MNNSRYVTALDIGSSKVAAIVGEKTAAGIKIIGYSEVPSDGVTRGEIIKIQKVAAAAGTALNNVREQIQAVTDTDGYRIRKVYVNGSKAGQLYRRYIEANGGPGAVCLPSTSPANASFRLERLEQVWGEALGPFLPGTGMTKL